MQVYNYFKQFQSTQSTQSPESTQESTQESPQESKNHIKCTKLLNTLSSQSPIVSFMLQQLESAGCPFDINKHFLCTPCDLLRSGGFSPNHGIILCENRFINKQHFQDTLVHELIHAFDHCTTIIKWDDCRHYACTEIRAAMLSGECKFTRELKRGNFTNFKKQMQNCIERRALLSMNMVEECKGEKGEKALKEVWDRCLKDTSPFDEIY